MPDPWPRSARWTSAGLEVGGLAAADLAERFGTPLLVIDEADLRERMRATAAAFPERWARPRKSSPWMAP